MKEDRLSTRNPRRFDINGFHPNIQPILRTVEKAWRYAVKDNDIMVDEIPTSPAPRSKKSEKPEQVYWTALENSLDGDQFINAVVQGDPRRAVGAFNGIYAFTQWRYPAAKQPEYTPPPGLDLELREYPAIADWQQRNVSQHATSTNDTYGDETRTASEADSVYSGENFSLGSETASAAPTSVGSIDEQSAEFARCVEPCTPTTPPLSKRQHRPKSLCLIGPSKLGKSLVARSFGKHNYFHGQWSVDAYDESAIYNVFDDLPGMLNSFDFKQFLGAQHDIIVTDKYKKKRMLSNGKPCIYISNTDPLTTRKGKEHREWLLANCIFVHIEKPICNIARINLEQELKDKEDQDFRRILHEAIVET
jgi:hypothetical protein